MKNFYFHANYLKVDLWQMSNSEKSLVLACCITYILKEVARSYCWPIIGKNVSTIICAYRTECRERRDPR